MFKRISIVVIAFALLVTSLVFATKANIKKGKEMGRMMTPKPAAVSTTMVQAQSWQPVLSAVGTLRAVNGTALSTDLAGIVSKIAFESGATVKKGDLLVELDTQQETAQLQSAQAMLDFAKIDIGRKRDLIQKKAISSADLDSAQTQLRQAEASVSEFQALLGRKKISAPFDGVIGIRQVSPGQYLNPGATIATLQSVDPIYVEFSLPQQHLEVLSMGKKLSLRASGVSEEFGGEITAIDSRIDEATRNIMVQGTIANTDRKLRPGMFVNVDVLLPAQEGVLTVPQSAINYATFGDSVFVVRDGQDMAGQPSKIVDQVNVQLGTARGDQVSILKGLKAGDEVAAGGVFRLQKGMAVQINNSVQPGNELNPKPPES